MKQSFLDSKDEEFSACDARGENTRLLHTVVVESGKWRRRDSKVKCRRKGKEASIQHVSHT